MPGATGPSSGRAITSIVPTIAWISFLCITSAAGIAALFANTPAGWAFVSVLLFACLAPIPITGGFMLDYRKARILRTTLLGGLIAGSALPLLCFAASLLLRWPRDSAMLLSLPLTFFGSLAGLIAGAILAKARPQPWECHHCGYDLRGLNPTSPCPECATLPKPTL